MEYQVHLVWSPKRSIKMLGFEADSPAHAEQIAREDCADDIAKDGEPRSIRVRKVLPPVAKQRSLGI
jgi:hypothetical protein